MTTQSDVKRYKIRELQHPTGLEMVNVVYENAECVLARDYDALRAELERVTAERDAAIKAAVLAEREACARLCDDKEVTWWTEYRRGVHQAEPHRHGMSDGAAECAAAIRARTEDAP